MVKQEMTLSQAAALMRSKDSTPEERSLAAGVMGHKGGKNSHRNDFKPTTTEE